MIFRLKPQAVSWIVVFLGNPGPKYSFTRHNVGFMTADEFQKKHDVRIDRLKYHALTGRCDIGENSVLLMKPQTYMNLSGTAVKEAMDFYKVPLDRILVVSDDITLPVGKLRIRRNGSAGGHNGLKDIIAKCGGDAFPRIKIGVGSPPNQDYDTADWVLGTFKNQDAETISDAVKAAADAVYDLLTEGIEVSMAKYN